MIRTTLSLAGALSLAAGLALADSHEAAEADAAAGEAGMAGAGHDMEVVAPGGMAMGEADPKLMGYMAVMDTMMGQMPMTSTGDPDADFLLMMIPHHQSAVDMARLALGAGDDPEVQAMAEKVIEAQEAEIATMKEILARMGVEMPAMAHGDGMAAEDGGEDAAEDGAEDGAEGEGEDAAEGGEEPATE